MSVSPAGTAPVLEAIDVAVAFGEVRVLAGVELRLHAGEVAIIEGASGSGKSTLLRALATLEPLAGGALRLGGAPITALSPSAFRGAVAYIAQQPVMFAGSVADNLRAGPRLSGVDLEDGRLATLLEDVGLSHTLLPRVAYDLSGGEKQRVAIARALASEPKVLLLDEPTSALDPQASAGILELVRASARRGLAIVVVTHVREHALALGGSRYLCGSGKLSHVA